MWRRKWQPAPVLLPRKFHELRSLVGYSSRSCKESDTAEHFLSFFLPFRHCNEVAQLLLTCIQGREHCPKGFFHTPSFYKPRLHFEIMFLDQLKFQRFQSTRGEGCSYSESPNSDDNHTNINGTVLYKHLFVRKHHPVSP